MLALLNFSVKLLLLYEADDQQDIGALDHVYSNMRRLIVMKNVTIFITSRKKNWFPNAFFKQATNDMFQK